MCVYLCVSVYVCIYSKVLYDFWEQSKMNEWMNHKDVRSRIHRIIDNIYFNND